MVNDMYMSQSMAIWNRLPNDYYIDQKQGNNLGSETRNVA